MKAPLELIKGQRLKLSELSISNNLETDIHISGVKGVSFFCIVLGSDGKLFDKNYMIHSKNQISPCKSITIKNKSDYEDNFTINLSLLPDRASEIIFIAAIGELNEYRNESSMDIKEGVFFISKDNLKIAKYSFNASNFNGEKTIILARIYKKEFWRIAVAGDGFRGGLLSCMQAFGISENPISEQDQIENINNFNENILLPKEWPGSHFPEIPQGLTSSVGIIIVDTIDCKQHYGTGFVISPGGYILTCCHVAKNAKLSRIRFEGTDIFRPLKCLAEDEQHDVALFWIEDCQGWPYWLPIIKHDEKINLGEPLGLLGYPLSSELGISVTYTQGIVNSCRIKDNSVPILQIDAGAAPGSSGGPVFRRSDGRVVGILQGGMEHYGMFINLSWDIRALYKLISPVMV